MRRLPAYKNFVFKVYDMVWGLKYIITSFTIFAATQTCNVVIQFNVYRVIQFKYNLKHVVACKSKGSGTYYDDD